MRRIWDGVCVCVKVGVFVLECCDWGCGGVCVFE